ncbi:MAG: glutaredoxin [Candidatus Marinimicrobia bacterium]|nr:glutaredoxin [Candidatus Neomarinimicrobiota bacterium]|tara:strand:- start:27223 stop:27462 length:240 start_codon:yes stop_codon:yes gene_type:complete
MDIIIYTTNWCFYCDTAKRLLNERKLEYKEINIEEKGWGRGKLFELTGGRTVPQIVINGNPIGGYTDLLKLDSSGSLKD